MATKLYKLLLIIIHQDSPSVLCRLVNLAHLVVEVGEAAVALRGSVKLPDAFDFETFRERLPNVGPQTVSHGNTHLVTGLRWTNRL